MFDGLLDKLRECPEREKSGRGGCHGKLGIKFIVINCLINSWPFSLLFSPRQSVPAGSISAGEQQRGKVDPRGAVHSGGSEVSLSIV